MHLKRSLIAENLNYSMNGFVWHDYPEFLSRLKFSNHVAGMLIADIAHRTMPWIRY